MMLVVVFAGCAGAPKAGAPKEEVKPAEKPAEPVAEKPAQTPAKPAAAGSLVANPKKEDFPVMIVANAAVKIDGDLSDWPVVPVALLEQKGGKLSGKFRMFTDGANLYVSGEVVDATPTVNTKGDGANYDGDAVEFFVGTHDDRRSALQKGDVQIIVSYNPDQPLAWNYCSKEPMKSLELVVKNVEGGYLFESKYGLEELGLTVAAGATVWVDFALDNSNGSGRSGQLVWHGTGDNYKNPSLWKKTTFAQ